MTSTVEEIYSSMWTSFSGGTFSKQEPSIHRFRSGLPLRSWTHLPLRSRLLISESLHRSALLADFLQLRLQHFGGEGRVVELSKWLVASVLQCSRTRQIKMWECRVDLWFNTRFVGRVVGSSGCQGTVLTEESVTRWLQGGGASCSQHVASTPPPNPRALTGAPQLRLLCLQLTTNSLNFVFVLYVYITFYILLFVSNVNHFLMELSKKMRIVFLNTSIFIRRFIKQNYHYDGEGGRV